jgi:hypothetical protein
MINAAPRIETQALDALPTVRVSELDKALARLGAGVRAKEARRLARYRAAYADHDDREIEERKHG